MESGKTEKDLTSEHIQDTIISMFSLLTAKDWEELKQTAKLIQLLCDKQLTNNRE